MPPLSTLSDGNVTTGTPLLPFAYIARTKRQPVWLIPVLLSVLAGTPWLLLAQIANTSAEGVVNERLYRVPGGYIGIASYGAIGVLTRYNDSLVDQVTLPYQDLLPVDIIIPANGPAQAFLLGAHAGRAVLYRMSLGERPEISPLWESDLPPFKKIIAAGDFDRDGTTEIAMLGDSALSVVGTDGRERYSHRGYLLDGVAQTTETTRFLLAARVGETIAIVQIDAANGTVGGSQELAGAYELMMRLVPTANGETLVVTSLGRDPGVYIFDPAGLFPPDRIALPLSPLAILPYHNGNKLVPAALFGGYPSPTILPLVPGAVATAIDYPLSSVLQGGTSTGQFNILVARDSLVLYDREMQLHSVLPSTGSADLRVSELGQSELLLATATGSRIVTIPESDYGWLARNWKLLAATVAGLALIALGIAAARRYSFVRTIYNNLVRVPGSYGVIVMTPRQRVKQINQSARGLLEIATYIPSGRHISEYLISDDLATVQGPLRRLFAEEEAFEEHVNVEREGSIRAITFRGRPLIGAYGRTRGYLLLVEDVTQTLERERLINWASVAHHIAHEMKTPLGTIRMTAEMLHDRMNTNGHDSEHVRATGRIIRQSARLREIVDDLLTIARTEALQKTSTDMALLLSSLVHDSSDALSGNIELRYEISGEDFRCMTDVAQLTVALRNLLDNAAQAIGSREGGLIRLVLRDEAARLCIIVEDNGVGMSRETLANIFKPFYTERQGGSGIGTVIIKRVIEGHGGSIRVESERGKGTQFAIQLPRA